jgi:hypothetical protein
LLFRVLCVPKYQTYWVACSHLESLFPTARWFFPGTVPRSLASSGSSSRELCLSFRVRAACHLPDTEAPNAFLGVLLPFATQAREVHSPPGLPHPTTFRPQRFSRSRRLTPSRTVAGLFHPTATSGIRSSGAFPAAKPARLIDESCPHVVPELRLTVGCPTAASSTRVASRALIRAAIRCD